MTTHIADRILLALFSLSRDTRPIDATRLGRATGHSATLAARALLFLEKHGWVDATRARLTLLGLARAVQIGSNHGGGGGNRRGPVPLHSADLEASARTAPKARRRVPLAALPAPAPAHATDQRSSAPEQSAVSAVSTNPQPLRPARRPCARARANSPTQLAAAHV